MSDIQRYSVARSELCPVGEESVEVMLADEVVEALRQAERDALDGAVQRVRELLHLQPRTASISDVLAAIKGDNDE